MSRLNFAQSLDFQGSIAASGNPKIYLDGGPTYDEFTFETNLEADEFDVIVEVDGDRRVKISGTQLLDREAYDGRSATSGQFVLSFSDALARTLQGEAMTGLVTQPGQRILVALEIAAAVTPVTPTAVLYTETSPNRPEEFRLYILPENVPVTQTGENQFAKFRQGLRPAQNWIRRQFCYGPVSKLAIEQDRRSIFGKRNLAKAVNDARLKRNGKTVPTSSTCFVFDPILKGNVIVDMLDTYAVESLRYTFTTTATTDITALTEYVQDVRPARAA